MEVERLDDAATFLDQAAPLLLEDAVTPRRTMAQGGYALAHVEDAPQPLRRP